MLPLFPTWASWMMDLAVTLFPLPDSPIIPSISPRLSPKFTS